MFDWYEEWHQKKAVKKQEQVLEDERIRRRNKRLGIANVVDLLIIATSSEDTERVEAAKEELRNIYFEARGIKI